jgi:hypothetical protein
MRREMEEAQEAKRLKAKERQMELLRMQVY